MFAAIKSKLLSVVTVVGDWFYTYLLPIGLWQQSRCSLRYMYYSVHVWASVWNCYRSSGKMKCIQQINDCCKNYFGAAHFIQRLQRLQFRCPRPFQHQI